MTQIFFDSTLQSKLNNLSQPLEICDESGRVVGRVFPCSNHSQFEPSVPQVSEEELDRRARSNEKRYATAEVLAFLEKL